MSTECCKNCKFRKDIEQWDYTVGCKHTKYDGFACTALASEGTIVHMVNTSETGCCEMFDWDYAKVLSEMQSEYNPNADDEEACYYALGEAIKTMRGNKG